MKKTGIFSLLLLGGMLSAEPFFCDFESGIDGWRKRPEATPAEIIDDPDTAHGKVLRLTANNASIGINTPFITVPEGSAGKPWTVEFDLRCEGNIKGSCAVNFLCTTGGGTLLKQMTLCYVTPSLGAFGWKHYKFEVGTGKRLFPEGTAKVLLRFCNWSQKNDCTGTIAVDNVKVVPPEAGSADGANSELLNSDFESGMGVWKKDKTACVADIVDDPDTAHGKVLSLQAEDTVGGVTSEKIPIANCNDVQTISFEARNGGMNIGSAALTIQTWTAGGNLIKQYPLAYFTEKQGETPWRKYSFTAGGATTRSFSEKTAYITLRLSFWNNGKNCTGKVLLDNVKIATSEKGAPAPAPAPEPVLPKRIVTNVKLPDGWVAAPEGNITLDNGAIVLTAQDDCVGINGKPVALEGALSANVTCKVAVDAVKSGKLTLSVLALDQQGKRLKQIDLKSLAAGAQSGKSEFSVLVGDGGVAALPAGTVSLQPRAVFWDKSMQCTGVARIYEMDILAEI